MQKYWCPQQLGPIQLWRNSGFQIPRSFYSKWLNQKSLNSHYWTGGIRQDLRRPGPSSTAKVRSSSPSSQVRRSRRCCRCRRGGRISWKPWSRVRTSQIRVNLFLLLCCVPISLFLVFNSVTPPSPNSLTKPFCSLHPWRRGQDPSDLWSPNWKSDPSWTRMSPSQCFPPPSVILIFQSCIFLR